MIKLALSIAAFLFLAYVGILVLDVLITLFKAIGKFISGLIAELFSVFLPSKWRTVGQKRNREEHIAHVDLMKTQALEQQEPTTPDLQIDTEVTLAAIERAALKRDRLNKEQAESLKNWQEKMCRKEKSN